MADDELEAIRAQRMAQLQQQYGVRFQLSNQMNIDLFLQNLRPIKAAPRSHNI
jgi:DNA-binding TFAR19-related protein (PDSD5 family)